MKITKNKKIGFLNIYTKIGTLYWINCVFNVFLFVKEFYQLF